MDSCPYFFGIFTVRTPQHPVDDIPLLGRTPDADAQSVEIRRPQQLDDGLEPVVARIAAAFFETQLSGRDIQLIMHHNELIRADLVPGRTHWPLRFMKVWGMAASQSPGKAA